MSMLGSMQTPPNPPHEERPGAIPPGWGQPPGPVAPQRPVPTSPSATTAMVLAALGWFCLGPIGGVAAIILGLVALKEIRDSRGALGGTGLAGSAIALGSLATLSFVVGIGAAVWMAAVTPKPTPAPPTVIVPPHLTPLPTPRPTATTPRPSAPAKETASRDTATAELKIGNVTVVDVGADVTSLEAELRSQRAKAARSGEKLVVETTSPDCRPCLGVAASLVDPKMQKALEGARLVRVDVYEFAEELKAAGIPYEAIPGFFLLGVDMTPVDGIHGGEWDDDTADNIAPVLSAFVRGKLTRRREAWGGQRHEPSGGTEL